MPCCNKAELRYLLFFADAALQMQTLVYYFTFQSYNYNEIIIELA